MKRLIGVLLLLSIVTCLIAWPKYPEVPSPVGANYLWDDTNKVWRPSAGNASGVPDLGAISVITSAPAYTTVTSLNTTATAASAQVASLAARLVVRIVNQSATETVWIAENSTVATVSFGLPLLPQQAYEEILGPGVPVSYISSTTCKINIFQGK